MRPLLVSLLVVLPLAVGCASPAKGDPGPQGDKGATGATGAAGAQGPAGAAGATGATGPAGAVGATGANGVDGAQGVPGGQGVPGAAGAAGAIGMTGPQGPAGTVDPLLFVAATGGTMTGLLNATFGVKVGNLTSTCNAGNTNVIRSNAAGVLEMCDGTQFLAVNTPRAAPRTCKTIKTATPAATTGTYTVVAANRAFAATCDMNTLGGGWTMIQAHTLGAPSGEGPTALAGSSRWLQADLVQSLALASTEILIRRTTGTGGSAQSSSDGYAISRLRQLKILTDDTQPTNNGVHWITSGTVTPANMNYLAGSTTDNNGGNYPSLYWASGNGSGLHVLPDLVGGVNTHGFINDSDGLEVLVR